MEDNKDSGFIDEIYQWPIAKLNVFDVWDYMFKNYITSATDQCNLIQASSQFFGPLLEKRKCSIHFGEVLHILQSKKYLDISKAELLTCRSWSKSCRESLDRSLQLKTKCYQSLDGMDHDICDPKHLCWIGESSTNNIQKWKQRAEEVQVVGGTDLSFQFPCGSLTFPSIYGHNREEYHRYFRQILSTVGVKTYHFRYNVWSWHSGWNTSYAFLVEFLELMPNLRTLEIVNKLPPEINGLHECNVLLESQTLPNLDYLTMIKVKNFPSTIVDALVQKYGGRMEKFLIEMAKTRYDLMYWQRTEYLNEASNLSQLSIGVIFDIASIHRFLNENISKSLLKLKSLSVSVAYCKEYRSSTIFKELCQTLAHEFGESTCLKTLNLFIHSDRATVAGSRGRPRFTCCSVRLNLPSVKRLWIRVFDVYFSSLDFILGLSNLEELIINSEESLPDKGCRRGQIKFVECWNRMEKSNVWGLMPKLQKITVRSKEYTGPLVCYKFSRPLLDVIP